MYITQKNLSLTKISLYEHPIPVDVDPDGLWEDNWQLSAERSRAVPRYLAAIGVDERRFQIAGFADTMPVSTNDTPESRANNRRVKERSNDAKMISIV